MTTVTTILTDAFRESNLIAISASPTANETTEGLRLLNRYIKWLFVRHRLVDINVGDLGVDTPLLAYDSTADLANRYVPENTRIITNLETTTTINLPPHPQDGARVGLVDASGNLATYNLILNGNGRTIEAAQSVTLSTNSLNREWFYRADTGNWYRFASLVGADAVPFPEEFDDLLVIGLAMRLNPRNGVAVDQQSVQTYRDLMTAFRIRYFQNKQVQSDEALLRLPSNRNWASTFNGRRNFDRGFE